MAPKKDVHEFAVKWFEKYRSPKTKEYEVEEGFSEECFSLGFEMDSGKAFEAAFPDTNAFYDYVALDKIINQVQDIDLLGSAIFSQWRYVTHRSETNLLKLENRAWFITALARLAVLSSEDGSSPFVFQGQAKKIRIVSNNICYGPRPLPDDEVEQHLTIMEDGRVWFSGYNSGDGYGKYQRGRTKKFSIDKEDAIHILNAVGTYFSGEFDTVFATDIGDWEMIITDTDGKTYDFRGSLCEEFEVDGVDLSDLIRDTLGLENLYVFDGDNKPDMVEKITIDYHRVTKIKPKVPVSDTVDCITWDYSERLVVARETDTLEHIQRLGSGCVITRKYYVEEGVSNFLDKLDAECIFENIHGNALDVIDNPNETKDYEITVDFKKKPQLVLSGTYDKNGLPEDWPELAQDILSFMQFYGLGEILDPSVYGRAKRRATEYIFCSVEFDKGGKSYYYITEDDMLEVGDFVLVPVGKDGHTAIVEIVDIEYFSEDNAPFPIEKTKRIIRKCIEDDFDPLQSNE